MKSKNLIILIISVIVCLVIATSWLPTSNKDEFKDLSNTSGDVVNNTISTKEQLNIIMSNMNLWYKDNEYEKYSYAVTDLDQNGRIEIISSICQGTGIYTYTEIYEINENVDGLNLCESNLMEYDSQADIIKNQFVVFYDEANSQYHYVFDDLTKNGAAEYYENKRDFCLSDGRIEEKYLARKTTIYHDASPTITYTDLEDKEITEEEYNKIENKVFENYEKMIVNIEWLTNYTEIRLEELENSYNKFLIYKAETSEIIDKRKEPYINAIKDLYYNHKLPDGTEFEDINSIENYDMAENRFAICDVDLDGKDELLIAFTHYPTAAMRTIIYDYDNSTNKFREQLTEFNWMNFYNNGIVEAMWSHNQGSAGDALWPYTMYRYNNDTDSYEVIAQIDAWDKSFSEKSYIADEFPEEIDVDNDGIVYFVTIDGEYEPTKVLDLKEYNEWRSKYITDENIKIDVSYKNFTEENINNIK